MGDIADMMLDGTLCEGCGMYLDSELEGFPQLCGACAEDRRAAGQEIRDTGGGTYQDVTPIPRLSPQPSPRRCPVCRKRLKSRRGVQDHLRDAHGEELREE